MASYPTQHCHLAAGVTKRAAAGLRCQWQELTLVNVKSIETSASMTDTERIELCSICNYVPDVCTNFQQ